ncbi:MAG: DUF4367 domain-containing protein [Oscillospiraceae bacterium]|nr:DUF4367 domain-containing protein [Oscillospiraceae bacterium]
MERTDEKLEELLYACAPEARTIWLDSLPQDGDEPPHAFSPEFQQRMERLIQRKCRVRRSSGLGRVLQRVAVVLLTVLLGGGVFFALDGEARAAVLQWFREMTEHTALYRFSGETPDAPLPIYTLGWVPDGLELVNEEEDDLFRSLFYLDSDRERFFVFDTYAMNDGVQLEVLAVEDTSRMESLTIRGLHGEFYPADDVSDMSSLLLFDDDHAAVLSIDSNLEKEEILHIARGLKLEDFTK